MKKLAQIAAIAVLFLLVFAGLATLISIAMDGKLQPLYPTQ